MLFTTYARINPQRYGGSYIYQYISQLAAGSDRRLCSNYSSLESGEQVGEAKCGRSAAVTSKR